MMDARERRIDRPEHVVHLPHWGKFTTPQGFDYLRAGRLKTAGYWVFRTVLDGVAVVCCRLFLGLKIEGRDKLRELRGGFITIANHVQMLDCGMVLLALPRKRVYFVSIEDNFSLAVLSVFVRWAGAVPIPSQLPTMREYATAMGEALAAGNVVHIYPEGFLDPYHTGLHPFASGAFHLALRNDVPIVPLAIRPRPQTGLWRLCKRKPCFTLEVLNPIWPDKNLKRAAAVSSLIEQSFAVMEEALVCEGPTSKQ